MEVVNILHDNETHLFWEEDGIICIKYKVPVIDIDIARNGLTTRNKITNNKPALIYADCSLLRSVTSEARSFYSSETGTTIAMAALAPSGMTRIIGGFFLNFNRPKVPFKLFSTKEKAFAWLQEHIDH